MAHAIRLAIRQGGYAPRNPTAYSVPTDDGSSPREVSVFQVADSALSSLVYRNLLAKNKPRFSARSYAYRSDLTAHDAIQFIDREFRGRGRLFIAEYDFRKYFDNISHDHLRRTLNNEAFLITEEENQIVEAFLQAPLPMPSGNYSETGGAKRTKGVPQGTSISLFLANVAAAPLDRALEHLGVGFARYADDTVIWSSDYGQLCRAVDELFAASKEMGVELNPTKSEGVRLLTSAEGKSEFRPATHVSFVGYKVSLSELDMKDQVIERVKARLNQLLFENLLAEPLRGTQNPARLGKVDGDYSVFVYQARRYLYGDLSESELRRMQLKGVPPQRFKGLMSFYPLIDDTQSLAELDRWLATQAWLAMRRRAHLLRAQGVHSLPPPHSLPLGALIRYRRQSANTGEWYDLTLPSFRRISRVVRTAAQQHGPNRIGQMGDPYAFARRALYGS